MVGRVETPGIGAGSVRRPVEPLVVGREAGGLWGAKGMQWYL